MILTPKLGPQSTRSYLAATQSSCFKTIGDHLFNKAARTNFNDTDFCTAGIEKSELVGPGSYLAPNLIGNKQVDSLKRNSASYSFTKETRDEAYKVVNPSKAIRNKSIPKENPGPAQYHSETLYTKPKCSTYIMTQARRFTQPNKFFQYKSDP